MQLRIITITTFAMVLAGSAACGHAASGPKLDGSGGTGAGPSTAAGGAPAGAAGSGGALGEGSGGVFAGGGQSGSGGQGQTAGSGGQTSADGLTATELVAQWDLGWNYGNSLDAPEGETAWGNPLGSFELFQAVAQAGFDVVRVPVTWSLHTGAAPDYVIDAAFLDRVVQVVDMIHAAGMAAIVNVHHDGADNYEGVEWLTLNDANGEVTAVNNAAVLERFVRVWTQIATRFQDHGENLLFESMNEIHDGYDAPAPEYYDIINQLNQKFVELVRESGGKNPTRHLVVPGYNTNIDYTVAGFKKPVDSLADHLILSIHYYDPYTYTITAETHTWGVASPNSDDGGQEAYVVAQFDRLKTSFIDQGTPMIMGEYGAPNQDGYADYRRYYLEYVTKAATDRGLVPVYWDNGGTGSGADNFALIDRSNLTVTDQGCLDAMVRAATSSYTLDQVVPPAP